MKTLSTHFQFAKRLVHILDTRFSIAGIRFGLDPLMDIVPGLGSLIGSATSCYLFWLAYQSKVPMSVYAKMMFNIVLDFLVGSIPVAGIVFDLFFRSNVKNLHLIEVYLAPHIIEGEIIE